MEKKIIIEIPYAGLGDHLFHSHLPRIAKETGKYEKVYISDFSPVRHSDYKKIVWEINPYIDGFVAEHGFKCDLKNIVQNIKKGNNLLDEVMYYYGLDDGIKMHEPEIYYVPKFVKQYHKIIYDPNFITWVGEIDSTDMMSFLNKKKIYFEAILKIRTNKALYISKTTDFFLEAPILEDFCDLIYSAKKLYCLTSGTATLASSLGKGAIVFYGKEQGDGFQHSSLHQYVFVDKCLRNKIIYYIKIPFQITKKIVTKIQIINKL